jgi:DNA-binding response OmpR family regulator
VGTAIALKGSPNERSFDGLAGGAPMSRLNVLVISTGVTTAEWLAQRLSPRHFAVTGALPGPALIRAVRERRPEVAVVDAIDARPGAAQLEVALLKDQSPGVQIIALSGASGEQDGAVIEQGVFCYLAGRTLPELLRVVQAAGRERRLLAGGGVHSIDGGGLR